MTNSNGRTLPLFVLHNFIFTVKSLDDWYSIHGFYYGNVLIGVFVTIRCM